MRDQVNATERLSFDVDPEQVRRSDLLARQIACRERMTEAGIYLSGKPNGAAVSPTLGRAGYPIEE